jgi:hypothetical protein
VEEIQCAVTRELNNISKTIFQKLLSWRAWRSLRNVQTNVLIYEESIL